MKNKYVFLGDSLIFGYGVKPKDNWVNKLKTNCDLDIYNKGINISLIIAAIIIYLITRSEKKSAMYILMGNIFVKRNKLLRNKYIENKSISVYYKLGLANVMAIIDKNRFNSFYVLDDDLKLLFIMHEDELIEALKLYGNITLEEYFDIRNKVSN